MATALYILVHKTARRKGCPAITRRVVRKESIYQCGAKIIRATTIHVCQAIRARACRICADCGHRGTRAPRVGCRIINVSGIKGRAVCVVATKEVELSVEAGSCRVFHATAYGDWRAEKLQLFEAIRRSAEYWSLRSPTDCTFSRHQLRTACRVWEFLPRGIARQPAEGPH